MNQNLAQLEKGQKVSVSRLLDSPISSKLLEMGLFEGQVLEVKFKAAFGDPIAVDVNGYLLSLRLDEAKWIEVTAI